MRLFGFLFLTIFLCDSLFGQSPNDSCDSAVSVFNDTTIVIQGNSLNSSDIFDCFVFDVRGYWYELVEAPGLVNVKYTSGPSHTLSYIVLEGACSQPSCLAIGSVSRGSASNLFIGQTDHPIYLLIYGNNGQLDDAEFDISMIDLDENRECNDATELGDGGVYGIYVTEEESDNNLDERWYSFEGNDQVINLYLESNDINRGIVTLYESCGTQEPLDDEQLSIYNYDLYKFFAESGKEYLCRITTPVHFDASALLYYTRGDIPTNEYCIDAVDITGNKSVVMSDQYSIDDEDQSCVITESSIWYSLTGCDSIVSLDFGDRGGQIVQIIKDSCGGEDVCGGSDNNPYDFFADAQRDYYLRVRSTYPSLADSTTFYISKRYAPKHTSCENSVSPFCGYLDTLNFSTSLGSFYYSFVGQNNVYQIELLNENLNGLYRIRAREGGCDGSIIASGIIHNVGDKVKILAEEDQEYLIEIFEYGTRQDFAVFEFNCFDRANNDFCEGAVIVEDSVVIISDFRGASYVYESTLCGSPRNENLWFKIIGDGNHKSINMTGGDFPVYVNAYEGDCNMLSCLGSQRYFSNTITNLTFASNDGQEYFIEVVQGEEFLCNDFSFQILTFSAAPNDNCENATKINCDMVIVDSTYFALPEETTYGCYNRSPGVWFSLIGEDVVLSLDLIESSTDRLNVSIFEGECENKECLVSDEQIRENTDRIYFHGKRDSVYQILLSDERALVGFEVEMSCNDIVANDECARALNLACGDTISVDNRFATNDEINSRPYDSEITGTWLKIKGDGRIFILNTLSSELRSTQIRIFESYDCDSLNQILLSDNRSIKFGTTIGQEYAVLIYGDDLQDRGEAILTLSCSEPLPNDQCMNPESIDCGDIIEFNLRNVTSESPPCNQSGSVGAWYELKGCNQVVRFDLDSTDLHNVEFTLYESRSCDSLVCLQVDRNNLQRYLEEGRNYLLFVSESPRINIGFIRFKVTCADQAVNDDIESAVQLSCGDDVRITNVGASSLGDPECTANSRNKNVWYRLSGNDMRYQFSLLSGNYSVDVSLVMDRGFGWECIERFSQSNNNIDLITYAGIDYYLGFSGDSDGNLEFDVTYEVTCHELIENEGCVSATDDFVEIG